MRFIHLYLIGYFVLVIGAGLALWQAGVLHRISAIWILIGSLIVIGLGILWTFLETPLFRPLYGTMAVLVLAMTLAGMTRDGCEGLPREPRHHGRPPPDGQLR